MPRFEDSREFERLVRASARMAENEGVSTSLSATCDCVDGYCKERVGDIANDRTKQHRRRAPESSG